MSFFMIRGFLKTLISLPFLKSSSIQQLLRGPSTFIIPLRLVYPLILTLFIVKTHMKSLPLKFRALRDQQTEQTILIVNKDIIILSSLETKNILACANNISPG